MSEIDNCLNIKCNMSNLDRPVHHYSSENEISIRI
jgi:hypothetical protein